MYRIITIVSLFFFIFCFGCKKTSIEENQQSSAQYLPKARNIDIYIENSGSMDGYVNGKTEFKGAIRDLLVMLKYYYDSKNIKIYFINSKAHITKTNDLAHFAQNINTAWSVGDRTHSQLNNIFKQVLNKTDNQTISILLSDYIYSIAGKNTADLLNDEKSLTKDAFLSKWKDSKVKLATTIVKLNSKFNGKYFPYTGDKNNFLIQMTRPYYMCVIGNQQILNDFNRNIKLKAGEIEGFENKYVLSSEDPKNIYYSVLNASLNTGRFKIDRENSKKEYIHGIKDVKLARETNSFTFAIAVDFGQIQAENDYICTPSNYEILSQNFKIVKIFPVKTPIDEKEIRKSDWKMIKDHNPTHIILLQSTIKKLHDSEISFILKKRIPKWVYDSTSQDDTDKNKLSGTTFGLKYWVEGIAEAYEVIYPNNKNYFECCVTIK